MKKLLIIIFAFISLSLSGQTTYYVDETGDDTDGDGSITAPWATLKHATDTITQSGNTIYINPGTITETSQSALAVGVNITGAGATSIIDSDVNAAGTPTIYLNSLTENVNGNQSISYIKMTGGLTADCPIRINGRGNVTIHHCTFENFFVQGVIFDGRANESGGMPTVYATGNKFYHNVITNCADYVGAGKGAGAYGLGNLGIGGQSAMEVYNNTITQTDRGQDQNGYAIKYSGAGGYKGLKLYNNIITVPKYDGSQWDFSIELWEGRGGVEIYDNTITGGVINISGDDVNYIGASDPGGVYGYALKVYGNTMGQSVLQTTSEVVLDLENTMSGGVYVYNNWIENASNPIKLSFTTDDTMADVYIYYNVLVNVGIDGTANQGDGIAIGSGATNTIDNLNILNNVIYAGSGTGPLCGITLLGGGTNGGALTDLTIRNNIIEGFTDRVIYLNYCTIAGLSIENNIFYDNAGSNAIDSTGASFTSVEIDNILGIDPLFKNYSFGFKYAIDFDLQSTSPAIGAGLDVGLRSDFFGHKLKHNPPDIGAIEYKSYRGYR